MAKVNTIIGYPGGKSRAVKMILPFIPTHEKVLASPFFGGGSVELACSTTMQVRGYDVLGLLVDFWQVLITDPEGLANEVAKYYPMSKLAFRELQKTCMSLPTQRERGAGYYVLNKTSFSGTGLSGGMSPGCKNFNPTAIQRLRNFKIPNLSVEKLDFTESIPQNEDAFLYLDPPYYLDGVRNLYGVNGNLHRNFNHKALADILHSRNRWVLSYNDCDLVRDYYSGYQFIPLSWSYTVCKNSIKKPANEVLILSHD